MTSVWSMWRTLLAIVALSAATLSPTAAATQGNGKRKEGGETDLRRVRVIYLVSPVFAYGKVIARYRYQGGAFEQHARKDPIYWTESKTGGDESYTFEESRRDAKHIFLHDSSRGFTIRLPITGGRSFLSTDREKTWQPLYEVAAPSSTKRP
jgi:hypothetical protein